MNIENSINSEQVNSMLDFLTKNGIIDTESAENAIQNMKQKELLAKKEYVKGVHNHKISPPHLPNEKRWKTYIDTDNGRKLLAKTNEEDFYQTLYVYYTGSEILPETKTRKRGKYITLEEFFDEWIEYKRLHTNAETYIKRIIQSWKTYYLGTKIIEIPLMYLDKVTLDKWAHGLIQDNQMTKTEYYNTTIIMRQSLEYAVDLGLIQDNQFSKVKVDGRRMFKKLSKKPDATQVFNDDELQKLFRMAWDDFYNHSQKRHTLAPLAVIFQFQTGLRIGELVALKHSDVEGDYIHIQRMCPYGTRQVVNRLKGNGIDRMVFLTKEAKRIIKVCFNYQSTNSLKPLEYIFSMDDTPLYSPSVRDLYEKYCEKMNTTHKSSHKARKTYISALFDADVNINTIREMVGHEDEKTTLRNYVFDRSSEKERNKAIQKALEYT